MKLQVLLPRVLFLMAYRAWLALWLRSCQGKVGYHGEARACHAGIVMFRRTGEVLNAYHCDFCDLWHLGHGRAKDVAA